MDVWLCLASFPLLLNWHVPSKCLLFLEAVMLALVGGRKVIVECLCEPLGMGSEQKILFKCQIHVNKVIVGLESWISS